MKKIIPIIVLLLLVTFIFSNQKCSSDKQNTGKEEVVSNIEGEFDSICKDSFAVVYRQPVNGYKVSALLKTNEFSVLTADITFEKNGEVFTLSSQSFGDTVFNKGWWGELGDNDSIIQKYRNQTIVADYNKNTEKGRDKSPMLPWTPFFFKDLDFDGVDEIVIVHYTHAVRNHSGFDVYRIVEGKPYLIDYPPYYNKERCDDYGMTDYPEFDYKKKTISCPYPEGELTWAGRTVYGISKKQKDTVIVNGKKHYFNHLEPISEIKY
jgi:hypothetical protein